MTMRLTHFARFAALAAVALTATIAEAKLARTSDQATVQFHATASVGGMRIDGTTNDMNVSDDGTTVKISVPLGNLGTGMELRNNHMRKALDVGTYPTADLTVARSALKMPAEGNSSSGDAPGTMKLHGKEHAVTVHYAAGRSGGNITVKGSTTVSLPDYSITPPNYSGVTVKPDVTIEVQFVVKDN
jgi:polyisoprenoid-binding protein YceI